MTGARVLALAGAAVLVGGYALLAFGAPTWAGAAMGLAAGVLVTKAAFLAAARERRPW